VVLRERVSSPGGTTVAAIRELDARGVRAAFVAAAEAARNRSHEMSAEFGG
jgi:pyrroline-5-carboxylate reductase